MPTTLPNDKNQYNLNKWSVWWPQNQVSVRVGEGDRGKGKKDTTNTLALFGWLLLPVPLTLVFQCVYISCGKKAFHISQTTWSLQALSSTNSFMALLSEAR